MKRKLVVLTLVAAMCTSLMTGCGNKKNNEAKTESQAAAASESKSTAEAKSAEPKSTEESKPQEITNISVRFYGSNDQPSQKAVIDAMNAYSAEKIGVTISFQGIAGSEYKDKVSMSLASKEDIDLVWTAFNYGAPQWAKDGALMEISDLLPKYASLYKVMPESIWNSVKLNGGNYYIPNYKETGTGMSIATPIAIADQVKAKDGIDFNEINMKSVWDYALLEDYLLACAELGVDVPLPSGMSAFYFLQADPTYEFIDQPYVVNKETGKVSNVYELPEFKEFVKLMIDWNKKGLWKEEQIMADYSDKEICKSGSYGVMGWMTVPDNVNNLTDRYGVPVYVKEVTSNYVNSNSALGSGWAITSYSKKADACMKWLELINTDSKFADLWVYGIEGTNYTREADGTVTKIADSGWSNSAWKATNTWVLSLTSKEAKDKKEKYTAFNESAELSKMLGFRPDLEKVSTELASVKAIHAEVKYMISYGFYDLEKLDEIIKDCKAAGSDAIVAELQTQVDTFLNK